MAIAANELQVYRSEVVSDASSNGAGISASLIASGLANNIFPEVDETERSAGSTKYRKVFYKNNNATAEPSALEALSNPKVFLTQATPADDEVVVGIGTDLDTQSDVVGTPPDWFGVGTANAVYTATDTVIDVLVEDGALIIFRDGDTIRVSDKATINGAGSEEYVVISGIPTILVNVVTITLASGLQNSYATGVGTTIAGVVPIAGTVVSSMDTFDDTTSVVNQPSAAFDDATFFFTFNKSTVYATWTLTFTGTVGVASTAYNITGTTAAGTVLGPFPGTTGANFAPLNPDWNIAYFSMKSSGWAGIFEGGDVITFTTRQSAVPLWMKRIITAGDAAAADNTFKLGIVGETA